MNGRIHGIYSWGVDEKNEQIVVDRAMAFECR